MRANGADTMCVDRIGGVQARAPTLWSLEIYDPLLVQLPEKISDVLLDTGRISGAVFLL